MAEHQESVNQWPLSLVSRKIIRPTGDATRATRRFDFKPPSGTQLRFEVLKNLDCTVLVFASAKDVIDIRTNGKHN